MFEYGLAGIPSKTLASGIKTTRSVNTKMAASSAEMNK